MTGLQSRMARAGLGLGVRDISAMAKVSTQTISRLEAGDELRDRTLADIRRTYELVGAEFIDDNGVRIIR
ncbi:transcriptional regulator [Rhizobium phaseoli]|nr:transcriptional regulator [Rhizobium phaseoli]MDK4727424.1 transcriptional regulator [Rhizobium phaseoli]